MNLDKQKYIEERMEEHVDSMQKHLVFIIGGYVAGALAVAIILYRHTKHGYTLAINEVLANRK